jgi:hypothetical protein
MVALDAAFISLRLTASAWSTQLIVPLLFIGAEVTLAAILAVHLLDMMRRTTSAAALLRS